MDYCVLQKFNGLFKVEANNYICTMLGVLQKYKRSVLLFTLLLMHSIFTIVYVQHQPITNDEPDYFSYSKRWLKGHPEKVLDVDDSKTPTVAVCWVPRIIKQFQSPDLQLNDWGRSDLLLGRYMMIVFFGGVFFYMYQWGRKLFGDNGWWLPLILLLIDPLFMAFSPVVTSDMVCTLMVLACFYHYWQYAVTNNFTQLLLVATFTGLACVTKSSLVFIPFIFGLIFLLRLLMRQTTFSKKHWSHLLIFIGIAWLVVNMGYQFQHSFYTWGALSFKSNFFNGLMNDFSFLKALPTLLPEPFIRGFDLLQYHKDVGPVTPDLPYKGVFILGKEYDGGVWFYYLITGLFKLPIGIIVLHFMALIFFIKNCRAKAFGEKYVFLLVPILAYGFLLSFVNPFQQGIRHAMIIMPFLSIGSGYVWQHINRYVKWGRTFIVSLLGYVVLSVATYYPDVMPYTNELIQPKTTLFNYLAEYNYLNGDIPVDTKLFLQQHPDYRIAPSQPQKGKFIIPGAFVFNSTYELNAQYKWLQQYKPVGHYRYVFLLYDIK